LTVSFETLKDGPPTWKPIWVKLIANSSKHVDSLKETAEIFKEELKTYEWVKNASTSSSESPGQFIFKFNRSKLAEVWLTPDDILSEVYFYTNWLKAGSIKSTYEDNDIVLKIAQFDDNLSPEDINNLIVKTKIWDVRVGDFATYEFTKAVSSINRQDGKITITVESDFEAWALPSDIQPKLIEFAKNYNYPEGISYAAGWENEENMDLIISTMKSLLIALFLIFSILVFQFNSYGQPAVVLYSVILALLWVNVGLWITWNPYSMPFMIWFIALTWVVVNDAIILIDRINKNLEKGIDNLHAVISAWKSRLQPIIVTTLTTVFGVLPLAMQDEFWAWLWYTIVFWLFAGSAMTLIVIPSLYYEIFLREKKIKKIKS
jgi:multidrug efflux pump subunit AcrB